MALGAFDEKRFAAPAKKLREQKNTTGFRGSLPGTKDRKEKNKGNEVLRQMQAEIQPIRDGKFFIWKLNRADDHVMAWDNQAEDWKEGTMMAMR